MNRGNRPVQQNTQSADNGVGATSAPKVVAPKQPKIKDNSKLIKIAYTVFLGAIAVLLIAMVLSLVFGKNKTSYSEGANVKTDKFQAVFLNGGQVYFGKISNLNTKYLTLDNIYYLRVNQQVQPNQQNNPNPNDISLVKLGCELHGPEDSMVINREQVIFWENLKTDGQVAKAVEQYVKANPDGQKCEQQQNTNTNKPNTSNSPATPSTDGAGTPNINR